MKLSTKIILPIILISALLILLTGCFGVPADESPGYTPGTITGIIAAPCCSTSGGPVSETSGPPEFWCYYGQETWSLQDGIEVVLLMEKMKLLQLLLMIKVNIPLLMFLQERIMSLPPYVQIMRMIGP